MEEAHYVQSSYRGKLIEHFFIGELLKLSWTKKDYSLEISKPEVGASGYDIIAEAKGVIRHIQLKGSYLGSSTPSQKVHIALSAKPSGCVVWIYFEPNTLKLGPFYFFGGKDKECRPDISGCKIAEHTKGNAHGYKAERQNVRVLNNGQFEKFDSLNELYDQLFCCA
jgi:hypothetical protein